MHPKVRRPHPRPPLWRQLWRGWNETNCASLQAAGIAGLTFLLLWGMDYHQDYEYLIRARRLTEIVNLAGRERMLSQRIANNLIISASDLNEFFDHPEIRAQLVNDTTELHQKHRQILAELQTGSLQHHGIGPQSVDLLRDVVADLNELTDSTRAFLQGEVLAPEELTRVVGCQERLTAEFDRLNAALTQEQHVRLALRPVRSTELFLQSLICGAVFFVCWSILVRLRGRRRQLDDQHELLQRRSNELQQVRDQLAITIAATSTGVWNWSSCSDTLWGSAMFWDQRGRLQSRACGSGSLRLIRRFLKKHFSPCNMGASRSCWNCGF